MANLDDLNYTSLSEMSVDEALELLRQIRLSRRIPVKKPRKTTSKRKEKKLSLSSEQAAKLLEILGGN